MKDIFIKVSLQPKVTKNEWVGPNRDGVKGRVAAPPIKGKANEALIRVLAEGLRLSPSQIAIQQGRCSREKILKISGEVQRIDFKRKIN